MNPEHRLLQRFLRYVQIDTTAVADAEGYPSSPGQLELGRLLVEELQTLGIADARQNRHGIVLATIPATIDRGRPLRSPCAAIWTPRRRPPGPACGRR